MFYFLNSNAVETSAIVRCLLSKNYYCYSIVAFHLGFLFFYDREIKEKLQKNILQQNGLRILCYEIAGLLRSHSSNCVPSGWVPR